MKKLKVTVEGRTYHVTVEPLDESRPSAPAPAAPPPAVPTGGTPVPSPLAGKIVSIDVSPGQTIRKDQQLMVLEAMKMNTYIYAPTDGTVGSVPVTAGDSVEEGQTLLSLS